MNMNEFELFDFPSFAGFPLCMNYLLDTFYLPNLLDLPDLGKPSKKKTTKFHKLSKRGWVGHLQCKLLVGKKFATRAGSRG